MRKNLILFTCLLFNLQLIAQEIENKSSKDTLSQKVKHVSLGVKLGIPNIAAGNLELIIPILDNHFAPFIDYSKFKVSPKQKGYIKEDDTEVSVNYSEYGINYYFGKNGKGAYLSIGIAKLDTELEFKNISLDGLRTGSGSTNINLNTTNLKFGIKSSGKIYFRFELGYGFGDIPSQITFTAIDDIDPSYSEQQTEELPNIPGVAENGIIVANIGFGISF